MTAANGGWMLDQNRTFQALRDSLTSYSPISDETWQDFKNICVIKVINKGDLLYSLGSIPSSYCYIYRGLVRGYSCDEKGNEYNKVFFDEGMFPGSMSALLTSTPSLLAFEAIEQSIVVDINFAGYRSLMLKNDEIKLFQIYYLEKNWLLAKDAREVQIVQEDATARYIRFVEQHSNLVERLPQYHIASHLGVTPTQLSRIRKNI